MAGLIGSMVNKALIRVRRFREQEQQEQHSRTTRIVILFAFGLYRDQNRQFLGKKRPIRDQAS